MKRLTLLLAMAIICLSVSAQEDQGKTKQKKDTIHVGGMVIVKEGKHKKGKELTIIDNKPEVPRKKRNISTNWGILDLGFNNFNDQTNYGNAGSYLVNRPGYPTLGKNDFKPITEKSINVNVWIFMQRLNLVKHYVNLKYGLGFEFNNYRYKSPISYKESGPDPYTNMPQVSNGPFIFRDSISFSKNKLATDYITVPVMLNVVSNPGKKNKGLSLSLGVSTGYLIAQRNKQKSSERGKLKNKGDYGLEKFKFSYIAEIGLGPVRLYGSYTPNSIYEKGLDMRPYTVGFRFSNW